MKIKIILALAAGFAAAASVQAATTVTTYTAGSQPTSVLVGNGSNYQPYQTYWFGVSFGGSTGAVGIVSNSAGYIAFTRGSDLPSGTFYFSHGGVSFDQYVPLDADYWANGAQAGDANYALLDVNEDGVGETVGQFHFGANGEPNYVLALATTGDGSALSISAGKSAIEAGGTSAVPEVSGHLALLALGSAGVLTRRRLKRAA